MANPKRKGRRWLWLVIIVLLLAGGGGSAWYFFIRKKEPIVTVQTEKVITEKKRWIYELKVKK